MNLICWTNRFKPIWKASQMKEMWSQESKSMTRQEERWKEMNNLKKNLSFYTDNETCPVCHSEISKDKKEKKYKKHPIPLDELQKATKELEAYEQKQIDRSNEIAATQDKIRELSDDELLSTPLEKAP